MIYSAIRPDGHVGHRMRIVTKTRATVHRLYFLRARRYLQDETVTTGPGVETAVAQAKETYRLLWVSLPRPIPWLLERLMTNRHAMYFQCTRQADSRKWVHPHSISYARYAHECHEDSSSVQPGSIHPVTGFVIFLMMASPIISK